ncbi:hypothetical protein EDEG_03116, partial [Edhazardia aedis USNM 41457]
NKTDLEKYNKTDKEEYNKTDKEEYNKTDINNYPNVHSINSDSNNVGGFSVKSVHSKNHFKLTEDKIYRDGRFNNFYGEYKHSIESNYDTNRAAISGSKFCFGITAYYHNKISSPNQKVDSWGYKIKSYPKEKHERFQKRTKTHNNYANDRESYDINKKNTNAFATNTPDNMKNEKIQGFGYFENYRCINTNSKNSLCKSFLQKNQESECVFGNSDKRQKKSTENDNYFPDFKMDEGIKFGSFNAKHVGSFEKNISTSCKNVNAENIKVSKRFSELIQQEKSIMLKKEKTDSNSSRTPSEINNEAITDQINHECEDKNARKDSFCSESKKKSEKINKIASINRKLRELQNVNLESSDMKSDSGIQARNIIKEDKNNRNILSNESKNSKNIIKEDESNKKDVENDFCTPNIKNNSKNIIRGDEKIFSNPNSKNISEISTRDNKNFFLIQIQKIFQ